MSSCDCSRPVVILQGASGLSTLYTSNGTLLSDRTVSANNNDLTFNMGTGVFTVNGLVAVSGLDLLALNTNPGDATTLWVSGNDLYLGDQNLSLKISYDAGNILTFGTDSGIFLDATIICNTINNCTLSQLGDVSNSVASSGHLLFYNGTNWIPKSVSVDSLSDVYLVSAPTTGQTLIWSAVYSAFIPGDVTQNLTISGGGATQTISPSDTLKFAASGDLSLSVASDTVTFGFNEYVTTLSYDSGTNKLTYTNESGTTVNITLTDLEFDCSDLASCSISGLSDVSTAGATNGQVLTYNGSTWVPDDTAAFSCSSLNTCSISDLSDVELAAPTEGQILSWSDEYSAFINLSTAYSHFNITDTVTSQQIVSGNSITFVGVSGASVVVAPTDTVRIAFNETTTTLTFATGTNTLTFTDEDGAVHNLLLNSATGNAFSCASLASCSIDNLSDVDTTGAASGEVLTWNGSNWVSQVVAGAGFSCADLNSCSITSLSDVSGTPSSQQALVWDAGHSQYKPSGVIGSFNITDGFNPQAITNGNSIVFAAGGDLAVATSATDTVTYSFTETVTTMTFNGGSRILGYTSEDGTVTNVTIPSGFDCTFLNSCSIDSLSDVNTAGVVSGNYLKYNGSNWVPSSLPVVDVSADAGNDLTLGTDDLPYFAENLTVLSKSGTSYIKYVDEAGGETTINVCELLSGCSVNSLSDVTVTSPSVNQIMRWNGSAWINDNESVAGSYTFTITDGSTSQTINSGNTLTFADSPCINATVSATDTVTFTPVIAGSRTISSATYGDDTFDNALICATGLFVPCIKVTEPTITTGTGKLLLQIPCGGSEWNQYEIPYFDNIKRVGSDLVTAVVDGDAATVGVDLVVDGNTGELFYNSVVDDTYRKVRSTYGYTESSAFTAATPRTITHGLGTFYIIVQTWLEQPWGIELKTSAITSTSENTVTITVPTNGTYKVSVLPVHEKV